MPDTVSWARSRLEERRALRPGGRDRRRESVRGAQRRDLDELRLGQEPGVGRNAEVALHWPPHDHIGPFASPG